MAILSKVHVSHHEAGVPTICQLKMVEKVKKLVDEIKSLYKCNLTEKNSRKANENINNFKEKFSLFLLPAFP